MYRIWHGKMCRDNNEKRKRQRTEEIELQNQEKIKTIREKKPQENEKTTRIQTT